MEKRAGDAEEGATEEDGDGDDYEEGRTETNLEVPIEEFIE